MASAKDEIEILIKVLGAQGIADLKSKYQDLNKAQGDLTAAFGAGTLTQQEFDEETKRNAKSSAELGKILGQIDAALDRQAKAAQKAADAKDRAFTQAIKSLHREQAAADKATAQAEARAVKEAAAAAKAAKALEVQSTFAGKYRQNLIALGYSANDFFSVQGSLSQRLNAIANNMPMLLSGFGGLGLALSGLLPIVGVVIQNFDHLKAAFGGTVDEGVTQLDRLVKRAKELSKEHVTLVVDRKELERSEQQLERLKKALSEYHALQQKQTTAEHEAGRQVDTALTEAGAPQIAEQLRQKFIREKTAESEQAGPLAEARKAQDDAQARLEQRRRQAAIPAQSAAQAQAAIDMQERAQRDIAAAQERASKAREAIQQSAEAHVGGLTGGAVGGHGADQAAQREQLAKELESIGRKELAGQVRGATPQAVKGAADFAEKQKAALESIARSGAADQAAKQLGEQAVAKGLDPEQALEFVKKGVEQALAEAFKQRGIAAPAGADQTKEGQKAAADLKAAITQIADRALGKAEQAQQRDQADLRRTALGEIKQDDLAKAADELAKAATSKGLKAGEAYKFVRDALAKQISDKLTAQNLGGEQGQEAALGVTGPAAGAALGRQDRGAAAGQKKDSQAALKAFMDELDAEMKAIDAQFAAEARRLKSAFGKDAIAAFQTQAGANPQLAGPLARQLSGQFQGRGATRGGANLAARQLAAQAGFEVPLEEIAAGQPAARAVAPRQRQPRRPVPKPAAPAPKTGGFHTPTQAEVEARRAAQRKAAQQPQAGPQAAAQIGNAAAGVGGATVAALGRQQGINVQVLNRLAGIESALRAFGGVSQQKQVRQDTGLGSLIPRGHA